ncbi:Cerato-platanin-domain-containing protein [Boletus edulis BED1]|uniref:Cerato-platanin-domain-containing protein n=1 Tax=Boletus edulis BED1 TaxID=1328754 RepID=A0AAD4BQB8_BOLED|nr:Cerato-platanin-domain-containing protein [Boletus edulis BED1]
MHPTHPARYDSPVLHMKLFILAAVLGLATPAVSQSSSLTNRGRDAYPLWYDTFYDDPQTSLNSVACWTGGYGLIGSGYNTFGDLLTYPAVGGIPMIDGWNSPNCGTCWLLTYTHANGNVVSTLFTAINVGDQNPDGFTISQATMNYLTNENAGAFDGATIGVIQMMAADCGF